MRFVTIALAFTALVLAIFAMAVVAHADRLFVPGILYPMGKPGLNLHGTGGGGGEPGECTPDLDFSQACSSIMVVVL
jgi:hypothetical protein